MKRSIVLVAHNLRSAHNVGALLRTCDGLGIARVYLTGYTPYPHLKDDTRLPHLAAKLDRQIAKTALGAEKSVDIRHVSDIFQALDDLKDDGYEIAALEQSEDSQPLPSFEPAAKTALIVGREVGGLEPDVLEAADVIIEIPMRGQKESFNVSAAAAMALYQLRFM